MELGSPQLYVDANRVARDMDLSYLKELGPYIKALGVITLWSEQNKIRGDKIKPGNIISSSLFYNMSGSFLLFRGAPMMDEWLSPYIEAVGQKVRLPGSNSCSKSPIIALRFAFPDFEKENHRHTLFVIACLNYNSVTGITMNNEAHTAYPSEAEVLLCEGCRVYVLAVDKDVKINSTNQGYMAAYNGKTITVVHLFHD